MAHEGLQLVQLPDELLVEAVAKLELKERHKALPLVCSRLHRLLCSPRLLQDIALTAELSSLDAALSLLGWLTTRCAGGTQCLQLCLRLSGLSDEYQPVDDCSEVSNHLSAAMAACSAAGGLSELDIELEGTEWTTLHVGAWAAALHRPTRLRFAASCELRLSARLGGLTSLQEMELSGRPTKVTGFASLPNTLTCLVLGSNLDSNGDATSDETPPQMAELTRLRQLVLFQRIHTGGAATAYEPLAALAGTLEHLRIEGCSEVPPCLGQLTALRSLVANADWAWEEDEFEAVSRALPQLPQLSRLVLAPISIGSSLSWPVGIELLPPGHWLASLRQLVLPASAVTAHLAALTAATQLQHLALVTANTPGMQAAEPEMHAVTAVLRWAVGHAPKLRRMAVQVASAGCPRCLLLASVELSRSRPPLQLEFKDDVASELTEL